jgi:hypothetical protein
MCSRSLFPSSSTEAGGGDGEGEAQVLDSSILHEDTLGCSDHCPVMLALKLRVYLTGWLVPAAVKLVQN